MKINLILYVFADKIHLHGTVGDENSDYHVVYIFTLFSMLHLGTFARHLEIVGNGRGFQSIYILRIHRNIHFI